MIPTQRVILGAGLAILLIITAASIGLDVKSRSDTAWVSRTVQVQKKISDLRVLMRRAESAARTWAASRNLLRSPELRMQWPWVMELWDTRTHRWKYVTHLR